MPTQTQRKEQGQSLGHKIAYRYCMADQIHSVKYEGKGDNSMQVDGGMLWQSE